MQTAAYVLKSKEAVVQNHCISKATIKKKVASVRQFLSQGGNEISQNSAYELVSKVHGYSSWNEFSSYLENYNNMPARPPVRPKVITVCSHVSSAKSLTAFFLSRALSSNTSNVLLVDFDYHPRLTYSLLVDDPLRNMGSLDVYEIIKEKYFPTTKELFVPKCAIKEKYSVSKLFNGIYFIPSGQNPLDVNSHTRYDEDVFAENLMDIAVSHGCDYVIIDTASSFSSFETRLAVRVADVVIAPVDVSCFEGETDNISISYEMEDQRCPHEVLRFKAQKYFLNFSTQSYPNNLNAIVPTGWKMFKEEVPYYPYLATLKGIYACCKDEEVLLSQFFKSYVSIAKELVSSISFAE